MRSKFFLLILLLVSPILAQQNHETTFDVKELSEFHDVIYQIWHTAWPEKNVQLLKDLNGDVQKGYLKIEKAELSGILKDKKVKWEEGVKDFGKFVAAYGTAVAGTDDAAILAAAEKLHSQYEKLVRTIRPVLKPIELFHQDLYMLYHHYIQKYDYTAVKNSVEQMKGKMEGIMTAKLPERLKAKTESFEKARIALNESVQNLFNVSGKDDKEKITKALDAAHSRYQELEKVFD